MGCDGCVTYLSLEHPPGRGIAIAYDGGFRPRTLNYNSTIQMVTVIRFRVDGQNRSQTSDSSTTFTETTLHPS